MHNVIVLSIIMLNVANSPFMLSVIMPSVFILNVVILSVVTPRQLRNEAPSLSRW